MRMTVAQRIEHLTDYEEGRGFESHQSYAHQMAPELVTGGHFLKRLTFAKWQASSNLCTWLEAIGY